MLMLRTLIGQTAFLSASHFIVRVMGFSLRIWLSRSLGAQVMGLVELAGSAQALLLAPVISGLPAAVSRMCAKADRAGQSRVLRTGAALALGVSLPLCVGAYALREGLALWLGDIRTLPALLVWLPAIPLLGLSCVLGGYCYGSGRPLLPAVCEIVEQAVRLFLCVYLVRALSGWPAMLRAAIPGAAGMLGEAASLALMLALCVRPLLLEKTVGSRRRTLSEMISLALPLTGMRLFSSLMRTANTTLIPMRLQASGLPAAEALSQLGMLNGMMMPVLMIPSFITCSLCMVAAPELTRRQAEKRPMRRLLHSTLAAALAVGLLTMAAVWLFAPLFAGTLYQQAELLPLLRRCCPLIPLMALTQVCGGLMNGLGLQYKSLRASLKANLISVLLMYALAAQPTFRLYGAVIAMAAGQLLTLFMSLHALRGEIRK